MSITDPIAPDRGSTLARDFMGASGNARQRATGLGIVEWQLSDDRLVAAWDWVTERIPPEDLEQFPDLEVLEVKRTTCGANVRASGPGVMQIRLSPGDLMEMTRGSRSALRGLVAHELAHAFYRHPERSGSERDGLAEEREADGKARDWIGEAAIADFRAVVGPPRRGRDDKRGRRG